MKGGRRGGDPPVCVLVSLFRLPTGPVEWRGGVRVVVSRVRIGSGTLRCLLLFALSCSSCVVLPFSVFAVTALLVWVVFLWQGCVIVEERRGDGCVVHCSLSSFSSSAVGVRGSARAALRARTLSPNTIASSCCLVFPFFCSLPFLPLPLPLPLPSAFLLLLNGGGCSPCVGALCWHDGDW